MPLSRPSPMRSDNHATAPSRAIGTRPSSGPSTRMRARYQRGPAMSGSLGIGAATGRGPRRSWRVIVSIRRAYGDRLRSVRHPVSSVTVVGGAVAVVTRVLARAALVDVTGNAPGSRCDHVVRRDRRQRSTRSATRRGRPDRAGRRRRRACRIGVGLTAAAPPRATTRDGRRWSEIRNRSRRRRASCSSWTASGSSTGRGGAPSDCRVGEWASGDRVLVKGAPRSTRRRRGACAWRGSTWSASSRWSGSPMSLSGGRSTGHPIAFAVCSNAGRMNCPRPTRRCSGARDRRRRRAATRDGRPLPCQRAVAFDGRVRSERVLSVGRRGAADPPLASVAALGRHAGVDRLVRGSHAFRAVDRPGGCDGRPVGDGVRRWTRTANGRACSGWR